jgi:PEP-CTERM putative exosortase interaction domain
MVTSLAFALVLASPAFMPVVAPPPDDFVIVSESAVFDPATQDVFFTLVFNRMPDFFIVDGVGRQADSFQYFVGSTGLPYPASFVSIIRGEEIHLWNAIAVRDPLGEGGPGSGGWGPIRGLLSYQLEGSVMRFVAPLPVVHPGDGRFEYTLESYHYGALGFPIYRSTTTVVPEPKSLALLSTGLVAVACTVRRRRIARGVRLATAGGSTGRSSGAR